MDFGQIMSFFGILIVFCALLFLAYVTTKYVGNKANKSLKGKYINIIDNVSIGLDKQLHLIKVGNDYLLIACSGKSVEFLSKVDLKDVTIEETAADNNLFDFKSLFDKYVQSIKGAVKKESTESNSSLDRAEEGEFFKSNLKRLKTINLRVNNQENNDGDEVTNEK